MEPIRVPALFRWAQEDDSESIDASHVPWQAPELPLDDERILVLDGDPGLNQRPERRAPETKLDDERILVLKSI